ncbi:MAG: queuine tRNA-ribosyltransferase family protein, partial [Muribaculaceae bacterium]|nr:queuine tRNA-ribosyltransferase family protein [Muribaculaceae bacterium]
IQEDGAADVDRLYSKAYLRHLFIANEILALQIASIHNLAFYLSLVRQAREHIIAGDFSEWKRRKLEDVTRRI